MIDWIRNVKRMYNALCEESQQDALRPEMDRALESCFAWFGPPTDVNRGYSLVNWNHPEVSRPRLPFDNYVFMLPRSANADRNALLCALVAYGRTMILQTGFLKNWGCSYVLEWVTALRYLRHVGYETYARTLEQTALVTRHEPILPRELLVRSSREVIPRRVFQDTVNDVSGDATRVARAISLALGTTGALELARASSVDDWVSRCDSADLPGIAELLLSCESSGQSLLFDRLAARDPERIPRLALALLWLGYPESGLRCLTDGLRIKASGDSPDHLLADLNIFAGNIGDGLRMYEQLIMAQPDNIDIVSDLCYHLIHQGLPDRAIHYGSRQQNTFAATANLLYQIGLAHWALRDYAAAEESWSAIIPNTNSLMDESIEGVQLGWHPADLPCLSNL